jgi:hypothetical protein
LNRGHDRTFGDVLPIIRDEIHDRMPEVAELVRSHLRIIVGSRNRGVGAGGK